MKSESDLMRVFRACGLERLAWALRRLHVPVSANALVLEVGSGGNPYPRSNVLLDAYEETSERHWVPLIADRPTVLGFVERLPFRDNAFDFVIASHVLEHTPAPERFLQELDRVSKAGFIETPHAFFERIYRYKAHRLEIFERNHILQLKKKPNWSFEDETADFFADRIQPSKAWYRFLYSHPFDFHVRYYWKNEEGVNLQYEVLNPEVDASWELPHSENHSHSVGFRQQF